jgi:ribosomal protein S18 acetylase RimI-like enzyme
MTDEGCLVPLPWETRNLGIAAFALSPAFLAKPDETRLCAELAGADAAHDRYFVEARLGFDSAITRLLEAHGFYFVEATVCPHVRLTRYEPLRRFLADPGSFLPARYPPAGLTTAVLERGHAALCDHVRRIAGESFSTDRFHGDYNCDSALAGRRYSLWVDDLLADPGVAFDVLHLKSEPIAFMARKGGHLVLAGFAKRYSGAGLGDFFWLHTLARVQAAGLKDVHTRVTLRNVAVLNLYARLQFKFRDPGATFHLWRRAEAAPAV